MLTTFSPFPAKLLFVTAIATGLLTAAPSEAQTYTSPGGQTFTNVVAWNFALGPIPFSDPSGVLTIQNFGTSSFTGANDLNFTLNQLNLNAFSTGTITLSSTAAGNFAFAGNGSIFQNGTGGTSTISSGIVLGSSATSLAVAGNGLSNTALSGTVGSNLYTGVPLNINLSTAVPNAGFVTLSGANTFGGGITLSGGNVSVGNATAIGILGNQISTLTINGGSLQNTVSFINPIVANSNMVITGGATSGTFGGLLGFGVSGAGGLVVRPGGTGQAQQFAGINTISGPITIGMIQYAPTASPDNPGSIRLTGAVGQFAGTSALNVTDGGQFEINVNGGNSVNNTRLSPTLPINFGGGFFQVINSTANNGPVAYSFGTFTGAGYSTILANANAANTSTALTFANVTRSAAANQTNGTFLFAGQTLGTQANGAGVQEGNIFLTQLGGVAPTAGLGGTINTSSVGIIPYALGDITSTGTNFGGGTGFVTYDTNGVRLLNASENTTVAAAGTFTALTHARVTGAPASQDTPIQLNSLFNTGAFNITGVGTITIANPGTIAGGALAQASGTSASIANPINFGVGGIGEGVVSVISGLSTSTTANTLTLNGAVNAGTLTKSGHGILLLGSNANVIGQTVVNAGWIRVPALANLGEANTANSAPLIFNMQSFQNRGGLIYSGTGETLNTPIVVNSGHMQIDVNTAGNTLTINSIISGNGGINPNSDNTTVPNTTVLTLGGTNTFKGGVRLGPGILQFTNDGNLGDPSGGLTVNAAAGGIKLLGNWNTGRNIAFEGALGTGGTQVGFDTGGFNSTWSGPIVGGGAIIKGDSGGPAGTWTITGANNAYTGTITLGTNTLQGGTLALSGSGDLNSASVTFGAGATSVAGTYVLDISGATGPAGGTPWRQFANLNTAASFAQAHFVQLGTSVNSPVDIRIGAGSFGNSGAGVGAIQGFGKLVKVGTGTFTLNTANSFTGNVEVWGGTLQISADNQLGAATNSVVLEGGGLQTLTSSVVTPRAFTFMPTPTTLGGAGPANTFNIAAGTTLEIDGNINGGGAFEKSNTGTLYLTGTNTYGGVTSTGGNAASGFIKVNNGNLEFNSDINLGTLATATSTGTKIVLLSVGGTQGGTLELATGHGTLGNPVVMNRFIAFQNANTNVASIQVDAASALQFSGQLVSGINTQVLFRIGDPTGAFIFDANAGTYTGTFQIGNGSAATGPVNLTGNANLTRTNITMAAAAASILDMTALFKDIGNLNINIGNTLVLGSSGQLTFGWNNGGGTISGAIADSGGTGRLFQVGTAGYTINNNLITSAGGYHVMFAGGLTLSSASVSQHGALPLQSAMTIGAWGNNSVRGPALTLNNTTADFNRIADTQSIFFNNSEIVLTTNATTVANEVIGSMRGSGYNFITMTTGGTLNFADGANGLTRVDNGTFLIRGASTMGTATATAAIPNVLFGNVNAGSLIGGGGAAGGTQVSILPYAIGDTSANGTGTTFVTYDTSGTNLGVRPLVVGTEYIQQTVAGIPASTSNDNVRYNLTTFTGASTITGSDLSVNSFLNSSTASTFLLNSAATERLIVNSGAILNVNNQVYTTLNGNTGLVLGIQAAELQTGAGNTRDLVVFTANAAGSGDLALGAKVTTSGKLIKSGLSSLYLTNSGNTYSGGTVVDGGTLVIDSFAAVNNFAGGLTLGGGYLKYRGGDASLPEAVRLGGGSAANPGMGGGFNVVSGTNLTVPSGTLTGFGGLNKDGTGVLTMLGTQSFSGAVVMQAGVIALDNPLALGAYPRLLIDSNSGTALGASFRFLNSMTFAKEIDILTSTATIGVGFDVPTAGNTVVLSGVISSPNNNSKGIYKLGAGDLVLTAASTYTGATQVFGGNLIFTGPNGSALNSGQIASSGFVSASTFVANIGGGLVLDNTAGNNNNRLPDPFTSTIVGNQSAAQTGIRLTGGNFTMRGNASVASSEVTNQFDIFAGNITLQNNGQNVTLTTGRVTRTSNDSVALIRGDNLGATPGPTSTNWFAIDMGSGSTQMGGAGGAKGTPFINIVPGFMGDTSFTGAGTDLVTYDSAVGFRLLTPGEYATSFSAPNFGGTIGNPNFDNSRAPNLSVSGTVTAPSFTAWTSAIKLTGGGSLNGSATVNVTQSTILATGSAAINVPNLQSIGNGGYDILTPGVNTNLTINSVLNGGQIFKWGAGTLTLTNAYNGTGQVFVGQGTLRLSGANAALTPIGSVVTVGLGATFDLGGFDRTISNLQVVTTGVGANGLNIVQDGTVSLGSNTLTLYDSSSGLFTGNITGTGGLTRGFFATGTTTLTQANSYTGPTTIYGGTLTLANSGSLASSLVDVRGGNLTLNNADDNGAPNGYLSQRLPGATQINLAGTLTITANANAPQNISFPTTNLVGGAAISATAGSAPTTLTFANLARAANRGVLTVTGTNLGLAQNPAGNTRVFFTQIDGGSPTASLVGGGGATGTTNISILPWAFSGSTYYTYGATNGLRPLDTTSEYSTNLVSPPSADANIRTTAAAALAGPTTVNSLIVTSGAVSGAFDLTVTSGAVANTVGSTIGVNTNALLTGNGNTNDLVVFASGATTLGYNVTTAGALVKYGSSTLTLSGNNTYGGGTYIHNGVVSVTTDSQLGAAGTAVTFGTPGASTTNGLTYAGTTLLNFNRPMVLNSYGALNGVGGQIWALNGPISGPGGISFNTNSSIYELNGNNSFSGEVLIQFGQVSIANDAAFGNASTIRLDDTATQGIVMRGDWTTSRLLHSQLSTMINTNGFNATWNGPLFGTSTITKYGLGSLTITSPTSFTGAFQPNAGDLVLTNRGAFAGGVAITLTGNSNLILDDTGTHYHDRIPDNAGTLTATNSSIILKGNANVTTEEVINGLTLSGQSTVTIQPGAGQAAILRLGQSGVFTRSTGSSILFRGDNLGVNAPGTPGSANFMAYNPLLSTASLVGGGGPAGNSAISIIAGAFGDTSATGNGTQLVTYDFNRGVRLLNASEYANSLTNGLNVVDNVHLNGTTANVSVASAVNALWMDSGATLNTTASTGILTLTAGNILVTGSGNTIAGATGGITAGANALAVGGPGSLTISSVIPSTQTGALIKTGDGTLTLSGANANTGGVTITAGTVVVGNNAALGTGTLTVLGGTLQGDGTPRSLTNPVALSGTMTIGGSSDLTFNTGAWTITNSTRTINVTNTGTTTIAGVIGQTGVPAIGLVKDGPGLLVLSGANTYGTNSSATSGFYLSNTTVRAGELRATNSTGSATGGSTVTVNSGGTLSGTGFIVPAQTTEARNLVSINTGGTIKPGSSPGTLTVGSAVTLGVTTATVNINAGGAFGFQYNTGVGQSSAGADTGGSGTFGVTNNHLTVNGTLNVNGGAIFKINGNFADYTPNLPYSYQVHSATAMSPFNITNPGQFDTSGFAGFVGFSSVQWHNVGNVAYFNFTPVPEPLHVLLIGGVAMLGGGWVRRRIRAPRGG